MLCYSQLIFTKMIKSIKWNPHYVDRVYNGEKLGENFKCNFSKVTEVFTHHAKFDHENCKEIIEETPTIYMIKFHDGVSLRIFNPIEVEFSD